MSCLQCCAPASFAVYSVPIEPGIGHFLARALVLPSQAGPYAIGKAVFHATWIIIAWGLLRGKYRAWQAAQVWLGIIIAGSIAYGDIVLPIYGTIISSWAPRIVSFRFLHVASCAAVLLPEVDVMAALLLEDDHKLVITVLLAILVQVLLCGLILIYLRRPRVKEFCSAGKP